MTDEYKWGKSDWTRKEWEIARLLREKGMWLTKVWAEERYNVYDCNFGEGVTFKNRIADTISLRKIELIFLKPADNDTPDRTDSR